MSHHTLMEQAIIAGPTTLAPPAFNGVGWLVVLNLGMMTACMWIGAFAATGCASGLWRHRADGLKHPSNLLRLIGLCATICFTLRCGGEALQLWSWNPNDVHTAAMVRTIKHYVDPFAVSFGLAAITLSALSWRALMDKLASDPPIVEIWTKLHLLKRPAKLAALAFVAAIGVVVTR